MKPISIMKTMNAILLASIVCVVGACNDGNEESAVISNEEAAEMVASSLAKSALGLSTTVSVSAEAAGIAVDENSGGRTQACSYSDEETYTVANTSGALTYSYTFGYHYSLTCGGDKPQELKVTMTCEGQFDGPRLASAHTGNSNLTVTELDESSAIYLINATYNRTGSFASKIRNQNSGNSVITIAVEDLEVNKSTYEILSGSASVNVTGTVTGKGTFNYSASVVFQDDDTATVTINGTKYMVDIITGNVQRQ